MPLDLVQIQGLAKKKEDENWSFRQFLKQKCRLPSKVIDRRVSELTERVWAGIDCTECANCCRHVHPTFSEDDIARIALRLGMRSEELVDKYLQPVDPDPDVEWETRMLPCPFLEGNRCGIYEIRPASCRGYPYLDKPDFVGRTIGMIERSLICPIVFEVLERLKVVLHFRSRRG